MSKVSFFSKLRADIAGSKRHGGDEEDALRANYFSRYRGVRVFRTNMKRSGAFGAIFLRRGISPQNAADEVRHEYGHIVQMRRLGLWNYFFKVFLPSARSDASAPDEIYYAAPWELEADVLGGVTCRGHSAEETAAAFKALPLPVERRGRREKR